MPPVRDLAWQLKITPGTVARSYKLAAEEGLVETTVGRGTFVTGAREPSEPDIPLVNTGAPGMVNFRTAQVVNVGQTREIAETMREILDQADKYYVTYPTEETDVAARQAVCDWIGPGRAGRFGPEDVVLTLGAQNATIVALMSILHGPAPIVLTDGLSYPGVRHACRLLRARSIGVEMDAHGMRPDALEHLLRTHGAQAIITSAEAHNPTCIRTTPERRREIVEVVRRFQVPIVEDDSFCIDWQGRAAYREICPDLSWYISALTKPLSSALRFGYLIAPQGQSHVARQVAQSSYYGLPQPIIDLGARLITSGRAAAVRERVQERVRERVQQAVNILGRWDIAYRDDLPFVWLRLPRGWRGSSFVQACERAQIQIKAADEFTLADEAAPNAVRIGLAADVSDSDFLAALETVSALLDRPPERAET